MDYNTYKNNYFTPAVKQVSGTTSGSINVSRPTGLLERLFGSSHKEVTITPTTDRPTIPNRNINVYDGDASAYSQLTGTNVKTVRTSESGGKVFVRTVDESSSLNLFREC